MIKNILCPVDRSPSSLQAFGYAIALARWQDARLTLLEVVEAAAPPSAGRATNDDTLLGETRAALERDLRRVLTARRVSDVQVEIVMRTGKVVQQILAQAKAGRADLIVMGSHGQGGVQRLVLGSVAEKVLRLATCPVLTVRKGASVPRRGRPLFGTILCPTDFSAASNRAVAYARRFAHETNATLVVMHAVEWPLGKTLRLGPAGELRKSLESGARDRLTRLVLRSSSDGPGAKAVVVTGKASTAIIKVANARSADLIVMGVSGRGATDGALLGSTTHHLIREATWPVLTVPMNSIASPIRAIS
jgi:nucleotide-binding universal stress UspA family protein